MVHAVGDPLASRESEQQRESRHDREQSPTLNLRRTKQRPELSLAQRPTLFGGLTLNEGRVGAALADPEDIRGGSSVLSAPLRQEPVNRLRLVKT